MPRKSDDSFCLPNESRGLLRERIFSGNGFIVDGEVPEDAGEFLSSAFSCIGRVTLETGVGVG
jgi:hypothetical protein